MNDAKSFATQLPLWIACGVSMIASIALGVAAGYRADEIAGAPVGHEVGTNPFSIPLWIMAGTTILVGALALASTLSRRVRAHSRLIWPAVLVVVGMAGAAVSLFALALSVVGLVMIATMSLRERPALTAS